MSERQYLKSDVVRLLLRWFRANARDLPWRQSRDPYAIWVSEIMLQQTQVQTVLPYYTRWLRELPTITRLANATSGRIHSLWAGLGYYTRVRNMQRAAHEILANHGGTFPTRFDDILALPGIGRYTAGAIASIAFNQPCPILDGNVIRVLARVCGVRGNPREGDTNTRLWAIAQQLVDSAARMQGVNNCSHVNQALMELGALICTPRQPQCGRCPVRCHCVAYQRGQVHLLPALPIRQQATPRQFAAFVLERKGKFLVCQRPHGVVNGHLWEFPNQELSSAAGDPLAAARAQLGFQPGALVLALTVKHTITRYRITMNVYRVCPTRNLRRFGRWCGLDELKQLPFPSAHRRVADWLSAQCPGT